MPFKKGSSFWKQRASHGPKQIFDDPQKLFEACVEYFVWCENNPLISEKVAFAKDGSVLRAEVKHIRAMLQSSLALFLGVTFKTFLQWGNEREDLKPVIQWAQKVIYDQKFTAAAAGLLNANIIARELGLADRQIFDVVAPQMIINPPAGLQPIAPPIYGEE